MTAAASAPESLLPDWTPLPKDHFSTMTLTGDTLRTILDRPAPQSPLPGFLDPRPSLHLLVAEPKVGKTTLCATLAVAAAAGIAPWPGARPLPQGRVLFVTAEESAAQTAATMERLAKRLGLSREQWTDRLGLLAADDLLKSAGETAVSNLGDDRSASRTVALQASYHGQRALAAATVAVRGPIWVGRRSRVRISVMRAPIYSSNPNELFEPATISNPQPLYARLRSETPLSRIAESGVHLVATWDLIEEALARESDFSANLTGVLMRTPGDPSIFAMPEVDGGVIATADEPVHSVHRGILQSRFSTQSVVTLEEPVRRWARESVREWLDGGAGDFVPVAELVPARVVGDLLGLPEGDVTRFRTWAMIGGEILAGNVDAEGLAAVATEASRMIEYLGEHLDHASANIRHDGNAPLLHPLAAAIKDDRISRDVAIGMAAVMFSAGGESTAALIGNLVKYLAEHPEIAGVLRETPGLVSRFVEEVGRLDPPFNFHYRVVKRSCELAGFDLHPGDRLMLLWASANRDPAQIDNPDELRLDRKHSKNHMTFGRGGHFCLGATIARLEGRIVCDELLRATAWITPKPGHRPVYANSIMVRRLEHLPLEAQPSPNVLI